MEIPQPKRGCPSPHWFKIDLIVWKWREIQMEKQKIATSLK